MSKDKEEKECCKTRDDAIQKQQEAVKELKKIKGSRILPTFIMYDGEGNYQRKQITGHPNLKEQILFTWQSSLEPEKVKGSETLPAIKSSTSLPPIDFKRKRHLDEPQAMKTSVTQQELVRYGKYAQRYHQKSDIFRLPEEMRRSNIREAYHSSNQDEYGNFYFEPTSPQYSSQAHYRVYEVTKPVLNVQDRLALLVVGMAGTGKTTFVNQLSQHFKQSSYVVNLDPAVMHLPYQPDTDIRKSIDYKELMKKHELGPNGAIMTALNLYCLQLNDLLGAVEQLPKEKELVIVDTPGQIEAFTWSSSGSIISQTFSTTMPTVLVYVLDVARCQNPNTLMSNLLFCCSIFYKMKLPLVLVFNKCDAADAKEPLEWVQDYEKFMQALSERQTYLSTLNKQMALTLEEFYENFTIVQVSSITGFGFDKLKEALEKAKKEYYDVTLPDLQKSISKRKEQEFAQIQSELQKMSMKQK